MTALTDRMTDLTDRMTMQRRVLRLVNSHRWEEELFGLSADALDRWSVSNRLGADSELGGLLRRISESLFFLATRSQEPVDEQYRAQSRDIAALIEELRNALSSVP